MEIILLQEVANLGEKNDVVTVKTGYARNYLIPKGFAVNATSSAKKMHAENIKQRAHKDAKLIEEAKATAQKLQSVTLKIGAKTSTKGKIFGSVNSIQIAEALNVQGFEIERKRISIKEDLIKEIGTYHANIKLHKEVVVTIEFEIVAE
jgi:large subunit ribosomal protein L9